MGGGGGVLLIWLGLPHLHLCQNLVLSLSSVSNFDPAFLFHSISITRMLCLTKFSLKIRGEMNRSNIRIKVFVHRCSNFVSLFELFVPLAHELNNPRSEKQPVLAMDESSASSSSVWKHFEKNKGAGTVTCKLCLKLKRLKWNGSTTSSFGTTAKGNTCLCICE